MHIGRIYTHHTAREATSHEGKANEEDKARAPDSTGVTVALLATDAVLVDEIDDEHPKQGADSRDPVDEGDVHGSYVKRRVFRRVIVCRKDRCIQKEPVGYSKLNDD